VTITVIGPVGSEIRLGVPPNKAAKNPTNIAPHNPAEAPAPEAIPNANAIGKATTAAVNPPRISPCTLRKWISLVIFMRNFPPLKNQAEFIDVELTK
jgi:hypothetical protein